MGWLSDEQLKAMWRSVQGPLAELTGPLIRFAGLVAAAVSQQYESQRDVADERIVELEALSVLAEQEKNWLRSQRDVAEAINTEQRTKLQPLIDAVKALEDAENGDERGHVSDDDVARCTAVLIHDAVKLVRYGKVDSHPPPTPEDRK